jgi:hypothetical protein
MSKKQALRDVGLFIEGLPIEDAHTPALGTLTVTVCDTNPAFLKIEGIHDVDYEWFFDMEKNTFSHENAGIGGPLGDARFRRAVNQPTAWEGLENWDDESYLRGDEPARWVPLGVNYNDQSFYRHGNIDGLIETLDTLEVAVKNFLERAA